VKSVDSTSRERSVESCSQNPGIPTATARRTILEQIRHFELLQDLRPEGYSMAILLKWDGKDYVRSDEKIELHDAVRSHGNRGDRGFCFFSTDSNRWESLSGLFQKIPDREF